MLSPWGVKFRPDSVCVGVGVGVWLGLTETICVCVWAGGGLIGMWWRSSSCSFTDRRVQFQFVRYFVRASGLAPIPEQLSFRRNAQQSM